MCQQQSEQASQRNYAELTDNELVVAIRSGDQAAFEQIVGRYYGMILWIAWSRGLQGADCENLAQDTFVNVLKGLATYKDGTKFKAWLGTIAHNCAGSYLRQRSKIQKNERSLPEEFDPRDDRSEQPIDNASREEVIIVLSIALEKLLTSKCYKNGAEYFVFLFLRYILELDYPKIGLILGKTTLTLYECNRGAHNAISALFREEMENRDLSGENLTTVFSPGILEDSFRLTIKSNGKKALKTILQQNPPLLEILKDYFIE